VAETTVKRLLCCGFRLTGKAMGQAYQHCRRICQEIKCFFQVRILHVLHFTSYIHLSPIYWLSLLLWWPILPPYKYILIYLLSHKVKYRCRRRNSGLWRWHGHPNWMQHCRQKHFLVLRCTIQCTCVKQQYVTVWHSNFTCQCMLFYIPAFHIEWIRRGCERGAWRCHFIVCRKF
jgi:hypothetical protein